MIVCGSIVLFVAAIASFIASVMYGSVKSWSRAHFWIGAAILQMTFAPRMIASSSGTFPDWMGLIFLGIGLVGAAYSFRNSWLARKNQGSETA